MHHKIDNFFVPGLSASCWCHNHAAVNSLDLGRPPILKFLLEVWGTVTEIFKTGIGRARVARNFLEARSVDIRRLNLSDLTVKKLQRAFDLVKT